MSCRGPSFCCIRSNELARDVTEEIGGVLMDKCLRWHDIPRALISLADRRGHDLELMLGALSGTVLTLRLAETSPSHEGDAGPLEVTFP